MNRLRVLPASARASDAQPTVRLGSLKPHGEAGRIDFARLLCWLIPFTLIVYLGWRRGGFEEQIRGPIGALLWVLVAGGLASWALPRARISRLGWIGLGLLLAYAAWTTIGISWSSSAGRSVTEAARAATYAGAFAVALLIGGRERLRSVAGAVGAGCAVIAAVALLSRLHPAWFPDDLNAQALIGAETRLRYPVGYWNALAGLVALGVPLVVWAATSARSLLLRGLAAAVVPMMALTIYFTYSRTGAITAVVGVLAYVALSRRRLSLLPPLAAIGALSAIVVWQGSRRDALGNALDNSLAHAQGNEMITMVLVAGAIAGIVVAGLAWAQRRELVPRPPEIRRRTALIALAATAVVAIGGFLAAGGVGYASDRFDSFKEPAILGAGSARLTSAAGNGRWQYWSAAVDAFESAPVHGIGPGTYEFWWNQNRDVPGVIKDAHSLYVENLAELGIIGLLLLASFVLLVLIAGARRALAAAGERRAQLAALSGSALTFALAAGLDWLWEFGALVIAFMLVAAAILATRPDDEDREAEPTAAVDDGGRRARLEPALRIGGAVAALAIAVAIFIPAQAAQDMADSRNAFDRGDLQAALDEARSAADLVPYAGLPRYQEALVLEQNEEFARAALAAREATEREPDNWETWYALSRIQAQRGHKRGAALVALRRAQELNPLETLINPVNCDKPGNPCQLGEPLGGG